MGQQDNALKLHPDLNQIQAFDRNLVNQIIITDPDKISSLIATLRSERTLPNINIEVIDSQILSLEKIRAKQIELTAAAFITELYGGIDTSKATILDAKEQTLPFKDNVIDAKDKFQQSAKKDETNKKEIEDNFVANLTKKQKLAYEMALKQIQSDIQVFKGYKREIIVGTPLQGTLVPKVNELISKADTESKVDEICKLLINNGQVDQALNISLDLFTTPLGNEKIRNHKRREIELRFINSTLPWARNISINEMKPKEYETVSLGEWIEYIEDIVEAYGKKDKYIADAVSDLKKQNFISKEAAEPLNSLMLEEVIYDELIGEISRQSGIKQDDIKFEESPREPLNDKNNEIPEAEIIDEIKDDTDHPASTTEDEKKIVDEAEAKAVEETDKKNPEDDEIKVKKGLIEIITKGMKDKSINIYNSCQSFIKTNRNLIKRSFNLDKFIKQSKEQIQLILDKEEIEKLKNNEQEVEKLADSTENKPKVGDKSPAKKTPNFQNVANYTQMTDEELNKIDPSMLETLKKCTNLDNLNTFCQQVQYDMPRVENPKFAQKDAYCITSNLFYRAIKNLPECKSLDDGAIKGIYFHDILQEGRKKRPELTNKDLKINVDKKQDVIKDLEKNGAKITINTLDKKPAIPLPENTTSNGEKDLEERTENQIEGKVDQNVSSVATDKVTSVSSNIKWEDFPDDIKKEFSPLLRAGKKEFVELSEKFLLKEDFKTLEERKSILANVIFPDTSRMKHSQPLERVNRVNNIAKNSLKVGELLKASSGINALASNLT